MQLNKCYCPKDTAFSQSDPQQRDANCNFTCLTKDPHSAMFFCLAGQVSCLVAGKANLTFGGRCRVELRPDFGVYSSVHGKRCAALNCAPRWQSWTYGQTPSKWFLCWTHGGTDCRHSLWVSWGFSLQTWEEASKTKKQQLLHVSLCPRCSGNISSNFKKFWRKCLIISHDVLQLLIYYYVWITESPMSKGHTKYTVSCSLLTDHHQ